MRTSESSESLNTGGIEGLFSVIDKKIHEAKSLEAAMVAASNSQTQLFEAASPELSSSLSFSGTTCLPVNYKTKLCQHWQQFKCNYGDACSFSHDCPGGPSALGTYPGVMQARAHIQAQAQAQVQAEIQAQQFAHAELQGTNAYVAQVQAQSAAAAVFESGVSNEELLVALGMISEDGLGVEQMHNPKNVKTQFCKHWQNNRCNHGDDCNFSHDCEGGPGDRGIWVNVPSIKDQVPQQFDSRLEREMMLTERQGLMTDQMEQEAEQQNLLREQQELQLPQEPEPEFELDDSERCALAEQVEAAVALLQNPVVQQMMASRRPSRRDAAVEYQGQSIHDRSLASVQAGRSSLADTGLRPGPKAFSSPLTGRFRGEGPSTRSFPY